MAASTFPGGAPGVGGGLNLYGDNSTMFIGNTLSIHGTDVPQIYGVYADGPAGAPSTNGQADFNAWRNDIPTPTAVLMTGVLLTANTQGWHCERNTVSGNATQAANAPVTVASNAGQNACGSGSQSLVAGGINNNAQGYASTEDGGVGGTDFGNTGRWIFPGAGPINAQGDSQAGISIFRGISISTSQLQLTADGVNPATAGSCNALQDNQSWGVNGTITGRDVSHSGNDVSWTYTGLLLSRDSGVGSTTLTFPGPNPPTKAFRGVGSGAGVTLAADPADGCLNVKVTPPNGDTWDWVANLSTTEVR
jgi:hypothetical protein